MAAPGVHDKVVGKRKAPVDVDSLSREEPLPVKTSTRKNNVHIKESDLDSDDKTDTEDKMNDIDKTNTELEMDLNDKTYIEDNNNDITEINIGCNLGAVSIDGKLTTQIGSDLDKSIPNEPKVENLKQSENGNTRLSDHSDEDSGLLNKLVIETPHDEDSNEIAVVPTFSEGSMILNDVRSSGSTPVPREASEISLPVNKEDLCIPDASNIKLPIISEILDSSVSSVESNASFEHLSSSPTPSRSLTPVVDRPKAPYKGTIVPCGNLKNYLDSLPTFNRKCMLRKGREVHKIYVDMTKGETFLDDQFAYTEFGRMVLTNGSIRAGRAKNAKQIVVARETLYCSGTSACKRACGGYGICLPGCDKTKMRGHRCSYRIKLTQRLGYVNYWFVEELGSHDQLNGKDSDFKVNSQLAADAAITGNKDNAVMDLSSGFKFRAANIPRTPKKLAPKSTPSSQDRSHTHTNEPTSAIDAAKNDIPTNYHYVLGLMPNSSTSSDSPVQASVCSENSSSQSSSQQNSAIDSVVSSAILPGNLATVSVAGATGIPQDVASQLFQANFINYMSTMTNLGIGAAALQGAINPLLVNVKQEPQDSLQGQQLSLGQGQLTINQGQGQFAVGYPMATLPSQLQCSPSHLPDSSQNVKQHSHSSSGAQGHSPSPSRGQGHSPSPMRGQVHSPSPSRSYRDRSPLSRDHQAPCSGVQKGLEIEAKIKNESSRKMQAQQEILGQVHNRIMERAKSRKSAHTMRIPQKNEVLNAQKEKNSVENVLRLLSQENLNIPMMSAPSAGNGSGAESNISSVAFQRFQTLNHVLQSDAFQAAKSQLEKKKTVSTNSDKGDDSSLPLNLIVKQPKSEGTPQSDSHQQYFKLAEEWKKGEQLIDGYSKGGQLLGDYSKEEQLLQKFRKEEQLNDVETNGYLLTNGHGNLLNGQADIDTDKLTENEKELMCRVRQLESHVKQLQNIVIKNDVSTSQAVAGRRKSKPNREIDFNKYNTRHVALKVMYLGHTYQGFAGQEETDNTIEYALFEAFRKTKLIESRETACYTGSGRTDRGVSAFSQVISIDLRSNLLSGVGVKVKEGGMAAERPGDKTTEIPYCHMLNKNLPPEIRVLAWAPVDPEFSSRFSCKKRTYKYFFPRGNLNIELMNQAAKKLIGENDYRNFCKQNISDGVTNFVRRILSADIRSLNETDDGGFTMYEMTIVGTAFLYHQIRCIMAVLILVGKELESPEVIDDLLDVEKCPKKPQYTMSADAPLCLYEADFGDDFEWIYEAHWHEYNIKTLQTLWAEHTVKASMIRSMLEDLNKAKVETECDIAPWSDLSPPVLHQAEWLAPEKFKTYKPLMEREKAAFTVQEKIDNFAKKRKLNTDDDSEQTADDKTKE